VATGFELRWWILIGRREDVSHQFGILRDWFGGEELNKSGIECGTKAKRSSLGEYPVEEWAIELNSCSKIGKYWVQVLYFDSSPAIQQRSAISTIWFDFFTLPQRLKFTEPWLCPTKKKGSTLGPHLGIFPEHLKSFLSAIRVWLTFPNSDSRAQDCWRKLESEE